MTTSSSSWPIRALPTSGGRSVSGPSYWPLNQSVPDASCVHVPDRQLVQLRRQLVLLDQIAVDAVDEDERRLHGCDVELGAAEIRMRLDAAIGDRQRAPVAEQQHFVRVHAVRGEFADAAETVGRVVDADHAGGVLEIVLGRVEQRAVGREHAVAEEMPARRAGDRHRLGRAGMVEHHGEGPRTPREHHRTAGDRIVGHVVTAVGQRRGEQHLAVLGEHGDAAVPALDLVGRGENRVGLLDREQPLRRQRGGEGGACRLHEVAPIDEWRSHRQSPSSEEKPAVSPNSAESRLPNSSERLDVTTLK